MVSSFLEKAAPLVLKLGWPVFPISRKKVPLVTGGFNVASRDRATIERWSREYSDANIAVPTGAATGLLVIDVDGPDGEAALEQLQVRNDPIPKTVEVATAQGRHIYLRYRGHKILSKSAVLGPQIDHRADKGCVIVPPSRHESGFVYRWLVHPKNHHIARAPDWIIRAVRTREKRDRRSQPRGPIHAAPETLLRRLERVQPGQRNEELNKVSFLMGLCVAADQITVVDAYRVLFDAAERMGLGTFEAKKTINSGLRAGVASQP